MKKGYKILLTASLLATFADSLFGPFYAVYVEQIGGDIMDIGHTIAVFGIATGFLMILMGKISDRLNKELIIIFGYFLYTVGTLGYIMISSPWQLFALQIVFALGTACLSGPWAALFAKFVQKGKEGEQWGIGSGGQHIIFGVGIFVGTAMIGWWGFDVLFLCMAALMLAATIVQARLYFIGRNAK